MHLGAPAFASWRNVRNILAEVAESATWAYVASLHGAAFKYP